MIVRIYRPSKTAMQSGRAKIREWVLEHPPLTPRRPEPLMGWTASRDTLNQVRLRFDALDDALAFAAAKGWQADVEKPHERQLKPRNYVDNFTYTPPLSSTEKAAR